MPAATTDGDRASLPNRPEPSTRECPADLEEPAEGPVVEVVVVVVAVVVVMAVVVAVVVMQAGMLS